MSDTTTLYEKCKHGRLEPHPEHGTGANFIDWADLCPGGRERTFEVHVCPTQGRDDLVLVEVSDE